MSNIIVVFPKRDNATNIRNLLVRQGLDVSCVCTTGAQVIHHADMLDEGVIVTGYKLSDMMYNDLREYLSESFEMLLVASPDKWETGIADGVTALSMPIKIQELVQAVQTLDEGIEYRRRQRRLEKKARNAEQKAIIEQAKAVLMRNNQMTEEEAHRYLQKNSMDSGTNMVETAQKVLSMTNKVAKE